jgi:hypothetical protein
MKQYSKRDLLDLFPEREPSKRIPYHDIRDDGVYLRMPDEFEIRVGLIEIPVEHPTGEPGEPALPFPFTLRQFLDFERTAGLVAELSDEEVAVIAVRNRQSHELARMALAAHENWQRQEAAESPLGRLLEGRWEVKLDDLPPLVRLRVQAEPLLGPFWDDWPVEQRKAKATELDRGLDFDEGREVEYAMEQGFAAVRERSGDPVDDEMLRRWAIDKAIDRMGERPLVWCRLPDDRTIYRVSEALDVTAAAIHPPADGSSSDADDAPLRATRATHLRKLESAVSIRPNDTDDPTQVLDSATFAPLPLRPPLRGDALSRASIARIELQRFARYHLHIALLSPARFEQRQRRRDAGRYTLEEAANEIAAKTGERVRDICSTLVNDAQRGKLPTFPPGSGLPMRYDGEGASPVRDFRDEAYASDLNKWLAEPPRRIAFRFPEEPSKTAPGAVEPNAPLATAVPLRSDASANVSAIDGAPDGRSLTVPQWRRFARETGEAIVAADKARGEYPSLPDIAERIAKDWRSRGIFGAQGKPLSAATIKREALKGITAGAPAFNSMRGKRGKQGKVER